jgi:hypothetical protein
VYSFVARERISRRRVVADGDKKGIEKISQGSGEEVSEEFLKETQLASGQFQAHKRLEKDREESSQEAKGCI